MAAEYPRRRPTIDHPFSAVPWDLISDERLGPPEVRIYAALVRMAFEDDTGDSQFGHSDIALLASCSERSVCRPLAKLEETGWIERRQVLTGHGRQPDRFHIYTERDSKRAEVRGGVDSNHADSRRRDHADLRGPTSLKEVEKTVALFSEVQSPLDSVPAAQSVDEIRQDFRDWYREYPSKKAPKDAERAYIKARKEVDRDTLLTGIRMYVRLIENRRKAYPNEEVKIKFPATWLNKGCWEDDLDADIKNAERRAAGLNQPPPMRYG